MHRPMRLPAYRPACHVHAADLIKLTLPRCCCWRSRCRRSRCCPSWQPGTKDVLAQVARLATLGFPIAAALVWIASYLVAGEVTQWAPFALVGLIAASMVFLAMLRRQAWALLTTLGIQGLRMRSRFGSA